MVVEELQQLCREELMQLGSDSFSYVDKLSIANHIGDKLKETYGINGLVLELETRKTGAYLVYRFNCTDCERVCGGFPLDSSTLDEDITSMVNDIIDGCEALKILNNLITNMWETSETTISLRYIWGKSEYCSIYWWGFTEICIQLGEDALKSLLVEYRNGVNGYTFLMTNLLKTSGIVRSNIAEVVSKFSAFEIHSKLSARLSNNNLIEQLSTRMIRREEAIGFCALHRGSLVVNMQVFEVVNQLGLFAVLTNWVVNYQTKTVSISIVDDRIIDANTAEIVTNYSLCSRIEQFLALNELELGTIFSKKA